MRTMRQLLDEYGESHQNSLNKTIHWVCVPTIFLTIVGLLFCIKLPFQITPTLQLNVRIMAMIAAMVYYFYLSKPLSIGMLLFTVFCLVVCNFIEKKLSTPLWFIYVVLFVAAWIGQFYGHKVEGKKPSFLKDLQFLLIGPAWLMSFIYTRFGIGY